MEEMTERIGQPIGNPEVQLPPVRWMPSLVEDVAQLVADALVRDLQEHPAMPPA